MRPDDLAASASDGAARTREAASAKAAAPFAAPFNHGALESSPAILSSSEAGRLVFDAGGSEAEARIASARGEARRCARTRRGSKLTPDLTMSPGFAHEALVTGEARRVARAAPCTRGRMVTDDDARDIVEGGGTLVWCVPVSTARGARASLSGRYDASSSIFERTEDSEPRDICGHLPYPHHAITIRRTMESPSGQEQAPGAKRQRKGKNTEPPNEDPDFTHCCIYNVSHADLVVFVNGFSQKDDAGGTGQHNNLTFMDTKIDTGPNKAGDFVETKSGRMMLQRSLCRPKFSSQVRSPMAPKRINKI